MIRILVFAALVLCGLQPAQANQLVRITTAFYGCVDKSDIIAIARLVREAPRAIRVEAVRTYALRHCVELPMAATTIVGADRDYVCLQRTGRACLWTLRAVTKTTGVDDGVF